MWLSRDPDQESEFKVMLEVVEQACEYVGKLQAQKWRMSSSEAGVSRGSSCISLCRNVDVKINVGRWSPREV